MVPFFGVLCFTSEVEFVIKNCNDCTFTIIGIIWFMHCGCGNVFFNRSCTSLTFCIESNKAIVIVSAFPVHFIKSNTGNTWNFANTFDIVTIHFKNKGVIQLVVAFCASNVCCGIFHDVAKDSILGISNALLTERLHIAIHFNNNSRISFWLFSKTRRC